MQHRKKQSLFVAALLVALFALAGVLTSSSHSQSGALAQLTTRTTNATRGLVSTVSDSMTDDAASTGTASLANAGAADFAAAARQNFALRDALDWTFGGKPQRGWSIYLPLIARTLDTESNADSTDFAQAVARWQKSTRLQQTGVLDRADWMQMIAGWQSRRLKGAAYPDASQLVSIPSAELYDPNRPADQRFVERETYAAYKRLLAAAAADRSLGLKTKPNGELADAEKFLKVVSAFRSRERQDQLRREQPQAGSAALAVNSPHFTGRALDLYVGGYDPVSTKDDNRALQTQTKVYRWLVRHAEEFGFRNYFFEPWHWEFVGK